MTTPEWKIKNYLDNHNIYKGNSDMQTIIINSFYNQHNEDKGRCGLNGNSWKEKLKYVNEHFGMFAQYANNNWKKKIIH